MGRTKGNQLRMIRQRTGLTQKELADRWGLSRETITRYETGALPMPDWVHDAILYLSRVSGNAGGK